jgi:hypothetical protein
MFDHTGYFQAFQNVLPAYCLISILADVYIVIAKVGRLLQKGSATYVSK